MYAIGSIFVWYIPLFEWITGILYINYFTFSAFVNPYYDTVHAGDKKVQ